MSKFVGAIDQGTTSSRFILFDKDGNIGHIDQREHEQINPKAGWVEHDATEIWQNTRRVINGAMSDSDVEAGDVEAIGITNQRETAVVWDRETGEPIHNAIVWQDTRTGGLVRELAGDEGVDRLRDVTGLPLSTYFSGPKITWLLDNVDGARKRAENGELLFGTTDSWVLWNLTGGKDGGLHVTDVTNASRTLLMDLKTLDWHDEALDLMGVPRSMLPEIKLLERGVRRGQGLGDRRPPAAGHPRRPAGRDVRPDLLRARRRQEHVRHRLVPARQHRRGDRPHRRPAHHRRLQARRRQGHLRARGLDRGHRRADPVAAGPAEIIEKAPEVEELAKSVDDNGGVYFVPAFSGLFAPHWRDDARGVIVGLTGYATKAHIARAALEATAWQSKEVVDAANAASDVPFDELRVDGGMTVNELLMQFQADVLGVPVIRPKVTETTALGAAYAAGLAVGYWKDQDELKERWAEDKRWEPKMDDDEREKGYAKWKKAVERSLDWEDED